MPKVRKSAASDTDSGAEGDPSQLFSAGPVDEEEQLFPCTQPLPAPVPVTASSSESSGSDSDGEIVDETTIGAILERARAETRAKEKVETAKVNAEIEARIKRARLEKELQKGKREREEQSPAQQTPEQFLKKKIKKTPTVEETKEPRKSGSGKKEKGSEEYTAILEAELRKSRDELAALKSKKRSSDGTSKTSSGPSTKAPLEPQSKSTPKRTSSKQSSRPSTTSKASSPGPSTSGGAKGSATVKRSSSSQSRDTTKEDERSTKTASAKKASPPAPKEKDRTPSTKAPRFKIEDVLTKKQLLWGQGRKTGYRRELSFRCPYCPHVVKQRDAMTTHLVASHRDRVVQEPRGIKGAQARVVNASTSGPRVLDEGIYSSIMGGLRGLMSARAYAKTGTAFKQLLTHVTANVGRADVVNLAPHAEFVAALNSAMADGDLSVRGGAEDEADSDSDGPQQEEEGADLSNEEEETEASDEDQDPDVADSDEEEDLEEDD